MKHEKDGNKITDPIAYMESYLSDGALAEEEITPFSAPVRIHIHSIRKREVDADGISAKAAIDGLVLGGILQDDSPKYVKEVSYSQEKGDPEETIITITEVEDEGKTS